MSSRLFDRSKFIHLLLSVAMMLCTPVLAQKKVEKRVFVMEIRDEIDPSMNRYVELALQEAKAGNYDLVIIDMDTYGGGVQEADQIRTRLLEFKKPIYVFINKNAASAGALISIACDSIYMAPGSSFGASTVVDQEGDVVPEKYQSFMRSKMRATAEANHRDPKIAEAMVGLYLGTDSAKVISFTPDEAIAQNYCEAKLHSIEEVLKSNSVKPIVIKRFTLSSNEKLIAFFLNPAVKSLLILIIMGGFYFELKSPGLGFPIVAAIIAGLLYFVPDYLNGLLAVWEIIIFIVGLVLLLLEVFVIPGFGIAGISGLLFMAIGLALSMLNNDNLDFSLVPMSAILGAVGVLSMSVFGSAMTLLFGSSYIAKTKYFKKIALSETIHDKTHVSDDTLASIIGQKGMAFTVLKPTGKVLIQDQIYEATSNGSYIDANASIVVKDIKGDLLIVKQV